MGRRRRYYSSNNIEGEVVAIIIIIFLGLFLFGSCTAMLFKRTESSSNNAVNTYQATSNNYKNNNVSSTYNNVVNNNVSSTATAENGYTDSTSKEEPSVTSTNSNTTSSSEKSYDSSQYSTSSSSNGESYVLNTNTKKFHRLGCSSVKQMKDSNKQYSSESREQIISRGYDPCKRCNP